VTVHADPVYVHGDSRRLFQVFSNVLHNANKYTPAGGQVSVTCERAGAEVIIRIRDTGIGIPTDMLDEVFDPMVQVHRASLGPRGGLGLGLTVAKRLIELHGGRIEAHSDGEGKGSEFLIFLDASEGS